MAIDKKQDIQSQIIPLIGNDLTRNPFSSNSARDQYFQNGLFWAISNPQTGAKRYYFASRPGTALLYSNGGVSLLGGSIYQWDAVSHLYKWSSTLSGTGVLSVDNNSTLATLSTPGQTFQWAETEPSAATKYLCLNTGSNLLVIDSSNNVTVLSSIAVTTVAIGSPSTVTTATPHGLTSGVRVILRGVVGSTPDVNGTAYTITVTGANTFTIPVNVTVAGAGGTLGNFPVTTGAIQYMNGYFYVITSAGQIYNCDFNNPLLWDPTKFITAQMYPGSWTSLARQNNFLLAFSSQSVQAFIDNANSTGSPLLNYESGVIQIGCSDPESISAKGSELTWAGHTKTGQRTVYFMNGLSGAEDIATIQIRNWLTGLSAPNNVAKGFRIDQGGKSLYLLFSTGSSIVWVYDYDVKMWCRWYIAPNGSPPLAVTSSTVSFKSFLLLYTGETVELSENYTQDYTGPFSMVAQTEPIDLDTRQRKYVQRLEFFADVGSSPTQTIGVSYSDDDGVNFTAQRDLYTSQNHTFLPLGGNFRRRVYRFIATVNEKQRWEGFELFFRLGRS